MKSGCNITKGFSYPRSARRMPIFLEIRRTAATHYAFLIRYLTISPVMSIVS